MNTKIISIFILFFVVLFGRNVLAGNSNLILSPLSINTVGDASGGAQYEGGIIYNATGTAIGNYMSRRRSNNSVLLFQPTATEELSLFFPSSSQPEKIDTIVLVGAYNINNGYFNGGLSSASDKYKWLYGASATITAKDSKVRSLLIRWKSLTTNKIP
jgi:hypothetical protein